jgi:hypothetical protein
LCWFLLHRYITIHGSYYIGISQYTVLITSVYHNTRFLLHWYITIHGSYYIGISQYTVIIIPVYHSTRFLLHRYITIHGSYYIGISQYTVLITSVYHNTRFLLHRFITVHGSKSIKYRVIFQKNSAEGTDRTEIDTERKFTMLLQTIERQSIVPGLHYVRMVI